MRKLKQPGWIFALSLGFALVIPMTMAGHARAQGPAGPSLPTLLDVSKIPVGAWAEYNIAVSGMADIKQRIAVVGRDAQTTTLELAMTGGQMAMLGGKATVQLTLASDPKKANDPPKKVVMQLGDGDPMEMPASSAMSGGHIRKADPKKLGPSESVTVPAGTFKARSFEDQQSQGSFRSWLSEDALPLGLVKMKASAAQGPGGTPVSFTLELTAKGVGAKPTVTKQAKPFDQAAFIKQMSAAASQPPPKR